MTTAAKLTANKRNAQRSTGPKTATGKAVARLNATSHGLRAASPVVPGEDPTAWEAFREAMAADLAPVGMLESELAERVAALLWRLRRVQSFEAGMVTGASDFAARHARGEGLVGPFGEGRMFGEGGPPTPAAVRAEVAATEEAIREHAEHGRLLAALSPAADSDLFDGAEALALLDALTASLPMPDGVDDDQLANLLPDPLHPRFLAAVGVPELGPGDPAEWGGWTAGIVRAGAERIAGAVGWKADTLLAHATAHAAEGLEEGRERLTALRRELTLAERRADEDEAAARRRALVPAEPVVATVVKYEGHLQRQLTQALHELERRQALRSDCPPHPPAALDVSVHAAEDGATTFLPFGG